MAQRATQKSNPVIVEEPLKDKPFERQKPLITIISGTRNRTDLTRPDIEQPAEVFPAQQAQPTVSSLTAYPFLHARRMTQQPSPRTVSMSMPEKVINHTCKNTNRTAVGPPPRRVDRRWFKKHMNPSSLPGPSRKIISRDALSHLAPLQRNGLQAIAYDKGQTVGAGHMPKGPLRPQDCVQTQVPLVRTQKGIRPQKSLQIHEPARVPIENGQQIVAAPFDIHGPVRHPLPSLAQLIAELPQLRGLLPDLHVSRFTPASPDHQPPIALPPLNPPPPDLGSLNMRLPLLGLPNISRQRITAELTSLGLPTNGSPMNQWERLLTYRYKEYQRQGWSVYPKFYVRPVPFDSRGSDPRTLIGHSIRSILQSSNTKAIIRFADATPDRRLVLVPKIRKEVLLPVSVEIDMEIQRRLDQAPRIVDASVAVGRMPAEHGSYGMLGLRVGDMTKMAYVRIVFRRVQVEFGGDLWLDR